MHAGFGGSEQRDVRLFGKIDEFGGNVVRAGNNHANRAVLFDLTKRAVALFLAQPAQVIQLGLTQHLHPVRVDQVEMADEPFVGSRHLIAVDDAFRAIGSGNSAELQAVPACLQKVAGH